MKLNTPFSPPSIACSKTLLSLSKNPNQTTTTVAPIMTVKRSRIARSMSFGKLREINKPSPPPPLVDSKPVSGSVMAVSKPILTVSSPPPVIETELDNGQGHFGDFLEKCYRCNKKLFHNMEIYMYGMLRGFCSLECRFKQMLCDKVKEVSQNSKGTKAKDQSGSQLEQRAIHSLKTVR